MNDKFYKQIPGWISDNEAFELYNLSFNLKGKILEIGTLYGKSTSCICESIRDSDEKIIFDSCDLNFRNTDEFFHFYRKIHGFDITIPQLLNEISFSKNKSVYETTIEYLKKFDLLRFVNLIPNSFHSLEGNYDFIFCDAFHDINEVNMNMTHLLRLSNNECIWAIHDIHNVENFIPNLINNKKITFIKKTDDLGVYQIITL